MLRGGLRMLGSTCLVALLDCASGPHARNDRIANNCQVAHSLTGGDELEGRIDRLSDGWILALHLRVQLAATTGPIEIRGLGRLHTDHGELHCEVMEAGGDPGAPRFDEALCLDEVESIADLLADAEQSVRPGETVVQEVRLHGSRRRRRARSAVAQRPIGFQERAEITRDAQGRVVRLTRAAEHDAREQIVVSYPAGVDGRCLPSE